MAGNEKSFWDRNEDDFWKKPVMDEAWLQKEKDQYVWEEKREPQTTWQYQTEGMQAERNEQLTGYRPGEVPPKKIRHVHTIICLVFIAAAVASFLSAVALNVIQKSVAKRELKLTDYEETAEADELGYMACYDNGVVYLEDTATTVFDAGTYPINPENKLIAIHVNAVSDQYVTGQYSMEDCYVGCNTPYGRQYFEPANTDKLVPYIVRHGYAPEQMITGLGVANGMDTEGYYFFYIPQEVTELILYCEKREKVKGISKLEKVYTKSYTVISMEK